MRKINEISTAMAKGFAAEMTEKMNNGMLKKGCPIMRGVLTVKSGKETEIREGVKRVSITVKVNYPFNILKPSNRRIEVIVENGELRNVKEIMYVALDAINHIASNIVTYTKGYWFDIDSKCYPDFVPTIEKYGIEWFERNIAAFYDYLTGLEYVNKAEAEEEVCDAPELDEEIEKIVDRHGDEIKHGRLKLNWDIFEEDFADYMVADDEFADEVMSTLEDWMDIEEWLTYDDGLYLRLPDDEEVVPVQSVEDYIMDISSRPSYVKKENITIEYGDKELVVGLFGSYFVKLYNDDIHAAAYCSEGLAWGKEDLMFAYDIMDYKSHIWAIVNENRRRLAA